MSNLDFPHLGLTISAIDEFIELCGGRSALVGKDTTQVNDFQKRITADVRKSYCEYLLSRGEVDRVGQASGVSYAHNLCSPSLILVYLFTQFSYRMRGGTCS